MPRTSRAVPLLLPCDVDRMIEQMRRTANEILRQLRSLQSLRASDGKIESVSPAGGESKKGFDRVAYQREYMRKWREKKAKL